MEKKILFLKAKTGMDDPSPPMAFSYLGRIAKDRGFKVYVENLNAQYTDKDEKDIIELIKTEKPVIVGVHIFTNCARDSYNLIKKIRPFCNLIIAGGPHPTACPEETLVHGVDIAVIGEAEVSFNELLDCIEREKDLKKVKGIMYLKNGKVIKTKPADIVYDLDKIPLPDRDVHRKSDYVKIANETNNLGQILSTRGCPGRCTYCFSIFSKCYRCVSAKRVFEEISYLHKNYGVTFINFVDDAFTINKRRLVELCDLIIESKLGIEWSCSTRADFLDKESISKMKESGCEMITVGIESCLPETLKRMEKTSNPKWYVDHADDILKWCKEEGIRVGVNILTGFPWESPTDMKNMQRYIHKIKNKVTNGFQGGILQPQPGTKMYKEYAKDYGFEKWWISKKPLFKDNYRPFFMVYYHQYWDHLHNNFFNFSSEVFKEIDKLYRIMGKWNLYIITKRRFRNKLASYSVYQGVYALSLLSMALFRLNLRMERALMEKIKKFSYRFKFRKGTKNLDL